MREMERLTEGFDVQRVHADALCLLSQVGLRVQDDTMRRRLVGDGVRESSDRLLLAPGLIERHVAEIRDQGKGESGFGDSAEIDIGVAGFSMFHVPPGKDELRPYTTQDVIEHTRLVDAMRDLRVGGGAPGVPQDVPPILRQLTQYYLGCRYGQGMGFNPAVDALEIADYAMGMADVMGQGIRVGVEPLSPMTFEGTSIDVALHCRPRLAAVELDVMPVMGVTAPLDWRAGWGQCVAETLGSYALLRRLGFDRVNPYFRLFPASMKGACLAFGSPEFLLLLLMRKYVRGFYGLGPVFAECMYTMSKQPDAQAAAEKMGPSVFAVLMGHRSLHTAGSLGLDEVFSPEQLVIDMDIRDYVERLLRGAEPEETDVVEMVRDGLDKGSFLMTDRTLSEWRSYLRSPLVFHQTTRAQWQASPRSVRRDAWAFGQERLKAHEYELDAERRRALEDILENARRALA